MPSEAIDQQPAAALPLPAWTRVFWKTIVHSKGAAHYKQPLGHIMRRPKVQTLSRVHQ